MGVCTPKWMIYEGESPIEIEMDDLIYGNPHLMVGKV